MSLDKNTILLMAGLAQQTIFESALREDPRCLHLREISVRRSRMVFEQPDVLAKIEESIFLDQTLAPDFDELVSSSRRVLFINDRVARLNNSTN